MAEPKTEVLEVDTVEAPDNWPYSCELESVGRFREAEKGTGDLPRRFWSLLVEDVPESGFKPPPNGEVRILDIGCGEAPDEAFVLNTYFSGKEFGQEGTEKVSFFGIDLDPRKIEAARFLYTKMGNRTVPLPGYTFIPGDATRLENFPEIPQKAQVVVFRNQQISEDKIDEIREARPWHRMFKQARDRLADGGIAIFTSLSEDEHEKCAEELKKLGFEITVNKKNQWARCFNEEHGFFIDGWVLMAKAAKNIPLRGYENIPKSTFHFLNGSVAEMMKLESSQSAKDIGFSLNIEDYPLGVIFFDEVFREAAAKLGVEVEKLRKDIYRGLLEGRVRELSVLDRAFGKVGLKVLSRLKEDFYPPEQMLNFAWYFGLSGERLRGKMVNYLTGQEVEVLGGIKIHRPPEDQKLEDGGWLGRGFRRWKK